MSAWGQNGSARSCDGLLKRVEANDPALKELVILPLKTFGSKEVIRLAQCLRATSTKGRKNTHLVSLQASGHAIDDPSALEALGAALSSSSTCPTNTSRSINETGNDVFLEEIAIGDSSMGDEGVSALCRGLGEGTDLALKRVDLSWKGIGSDGLYAILRVLGNQKSLESLNLARNEKIGPFFDFLSVPSIPSASPLFPNLKHLDFSECQLNAKSCASLLRALSTATASVPEEDTRLNDAFIQTPPRGLALKLNSNDLSDALHTKDMMEVVLCGPLIEELHMSGCLLGDEGLRGIVDLCYNGTDSLQENDHGKRHSNKLRLLDLSNNNLTSESLNYFATQLLASSASCNRPIFSGICQLNLSGNTLDEEFCRSFATCIEQGPLLSLKELDVSRTRCSVAGAVALLSCNADTKDGDTSHSSMKVLNLFGNQLRSEGFVEMSKVLQGGHSKLESLDLGGNEATEAGVVALLNAISSETMDEKRNSLCLLTVGGNQGGASVEAVIKEIKRVHPKLDIARDKPLRQNNSSSRAFGNMNLPVQAPGTSWMG